MYSIGDRVVYPMHGAGIIEAIEEHEVLGKTQKYYIMRMPFGDMKVMIPMSNVDEIGIRDVIDEKEADKVLEEMGKACTEDDINWNKRYRDNMDKIKTGDIYEVAHVVKSLMLRDKTKGLSTGERKMLTNAKHILVSEIVLAKGALKQDVEAQIDEIVSRELM